MVGSLHGLTLGSAHNAVHSTPRRRIAACGVLNSAAMSSDQTSRPDDERRVVRFRRGPAGTRAPVPAPPPIDDLAKFERGSEKDDYRHRMIVNVVAFLFVVALIGAGLWLADSLASLRRNQDCALAGHRNCVPIETNR